MKKIILLLFVFLLARNMYAQDAHLSMYDAAPLFLNPAMTGLVDGNYRVHGQYRTQWKAVNFKPYNSALISFDMPYKKWGFGLQITNFRAGYGNFNVLQGLASVAYSISLNKNKTHNLSFGLQGGATQKSLEYQLLTFNNQYSLANGGEFTQTVANGENFGAASDLLAAANAGILYYYSKPQSKLNPFIGLSAFNLLQPKESFYNFDNRLPFRTYLHFGTRINLTELLYVNLKALIMHQRKFNEQTIAAEVGYYLKSSETFLIGGLILRSRDAAILSIGAKQNNFLLKLGYDINLSSLSRVTSGRGGFEIALTYTYKKKRELQEQKQCPRL